MKRFNWKKIENYLIQIIDENKQNSEVDIEYIVEILDECDLLPDDADDIFKAYNRLLTVYHTVMRQALKEERYEICAMLKEVIEYEQNEMMKIIEQHFEITVQKQLFEELQGVNKKFEELYKQEDDGDII